MADINTQAVQQALDDGLNPNDIINSMVNQGIDSLEASSAVESLSVQIPSITKKQLIEPLEPIEVSTPLRPDEFDTQLVSEETFTPVKTEENKELILNELDNPESELLSSLNPVQREFFTRFILPDRPLDPVEIVAKLENIHIKYQPIKLGQALLGDPISRIEMAQDSADVTQNVLIGLQRLLPDLEIRKVLNIGTEKQQFIGPEDPLFNIAIPNAELVIQNPNDPKIFDILTPSLWQSISAAKFETVGAVGGAFGGLAIGTKLASQFIPAATPPTALAKLGVFGASILIGGATGAGTGRAADIIFNSLELKEDIDELRVINQMADAAFTDVLFTIGGAGILKAGIGTTKSIFNIGKGAISKLQANRSVPIMINMMNITEKQADQIFTTYMKINNITKISVDDKIRILSQTGEPARTGRISPLVLLAGSQNMKAANVMADEASKRAKELKREMNQLRDPSAVTEFQKKLDTYITDSEASYASTKKIIGDIGPNLIPLGIKFNYNLSIIGPLNRALKINIENPIKDRIIKEFLARIPVDKLTGKTTIKDLADTRTVIADFLRKEELAEGQKSAVKASIRNLDRKIADVVKRESNELLTSWHEGYKISLNIREDMFANKEDILVSALKLRRANKEEQSKIFIDYLSTGDKVYERVIKRIPWAAEAIEVEVANNLIGRHAIKDPITNEILGINFVTLSEEISRQKFKSSQAKNIKQLVNQMGKVYTIDPVLAGLRGGPTTTGVSSGIGTDLAYRMRVAMSSNIFQRAFSFIGTRKAKEVTLGTTLIRVLEKPLDDKAIKELMGILDFKSTDELMTSRIGQDLRDIQIQNIKEGLDISSIPVETIFGVSKLGKEVTEKIGSFGSGFQYNTSRSKAVKKLTSATQRVKERKVHGYRIAKEDILTILLGKTATVSRLKEDDFNVRKELLKKGYLGYQIGDDIILYK